MTPDDTGRDTPRGTDARLPAGARPRPYRTPRVTVGAGAPRKAATG